ncbi:GAF and ANTAR domain-containing protein [Jatrophihabitans lederbergiae]|uniref:GAF and ANTAR domain-containing protein n=1 Tax=Jatrophihabitans lederbergiae TaxID=3075547 RepID=A0ABU2J7A9_9ACTN|nr:GAF and ANTAR domain-containing protein [Jatrophihabitans sp. DSM 44399]MDT0260631.1 GAF and ANTAR domain-containing protein [Jatrophihabitans sp. DSM 44399]
MSTDSHRSDEALQLPAAYSEFQNLLLDGPDVATFMQQIVNLASAIVSPSAQCGVTLRRDREISTIANSGDLAVRADEIQYGRGQGPCLEALHTGVVVSVPDLATDERWPDYRSHALTQGVRSSLSLPLTVQGATLGALNIYTSNQHDFTAGEIGHATAFAKQAATGLAIVLRHADQVKLEDQLREALATRAVIDQALGIVMGQRGCGAAEAFSVLREASQHRNRKLHDIAAELIETITGEPPQRPRPFIQRG